MPTLAEADVKRLENDITGQVGQFVSLMKANDQRQYKRMFIGFTVVLVVILVFASLFMYVLNNVTNSLNETTGVLSRRSPVLEYLQCHDAATDTRAAAADAYIFYTVTAAASGGEIDPDEQATQLNLFHMYEEASKALADSRNPNSDRACPELPLKGTGG
jgi:hypothetical protein